jgi:hypothetical protein
MIKPNPEGIMHSMQEKRGKTKRLVIMLPEAYYWLFKDISKVFGRTMTDEFKLAINRRALEVGLQPVQDANLFLLMKEYQIYPTDKQDD